MHIGMVAVALAPVQWWLKQCGQGSAAAWMSDSEQARHARIAHAARQQEFVAGRIALRALLARHVPGTHWRDWQLEAPENMPPRIRPCVATNPQLAAIEPLRLSVSHSGGLLAVALADQPVGVDLEASQKPRMLDGLIDIVCTPREKSRIAQLPPSLRQAAFDAIWTLKEAWFKRETTGIDLGMITCLETVTDLPASLQHNSWQAVGQRYTLALCVSTLQDRVVQWRFDGIGTAPETMRCHAEYKGEYCRGGIDKNQRLTGLGS